MGLISMFSVPPGLHGPPDRPARSVLFARLALIASAYGIASIASMELALQPKFVSPFWLPSAIALCACVAWGLIIAPAVWLGAFVGLLSFGMSIVPAMIIATGGMLEAVVATLLVRRLYHTRTDFLYRASPFRFIAIALVSSTISATLGTFGLAMAQHDGISYGVHWIAWWIGDAVGMIVGVPLILAWNPAHGMRWRPAKMAEMGAYLALLLTVAQVAFGGMVGNWPLAYLTIPFFLWAAIRFNLPTVTWTTTIICAVAVWHTAQGNGPFYVGDLTRSLSLLLIYIGVVASMGLVVAHLAYARSSAEFLLREERDGLERRVHQRTRALVNDLEERRRIEQKLAAREHQLAEAQRLAQLGSWTWDLASDEIIWSDELYRIYGVDRASFHVTPESISRLIAPEDLPRLRELVYASLKSGEPFRAEYRILAQGGTPRTVAARGEVLRNAAGRPVRAVGTVQDISEAKRAETSLREAEERYRKVVELSPDAILVQQGGCFVYANPAAVRLLEASSASEILGRTLSEFLPDSFHTLARGRADRLERNKTLVAVDEKLRRLDGRDLDVEISTSPFLHAGRPASLLIMRDVTERKRTLEQMAYLAHYDSLTGLPNRMLFHQRLEHALMIAERPGRSLEVLFLDLDRFKNINDTLGHATGDLVLKEAASRLQGILRESDTVARLGGDEFVVLVENVDEPHRGGVIAEKILAAFIPPFMRDKEPLSISTSIGISSFPSDGTDSDTLLKKADIAMYRAKELGRNSYCYFSEEMNQHAIERLAMENALGRAIELAQLSLHYQPKIDIMTNRITGMEALLRWDHPILGPLPPDRFLPLAEESGLIRPVGYWALRTACRQNKLWQDASPVRLRVAVNLSPRQLSDIRLIENIDAILDDTGLPPEYLELEVSEAAVMSDPERMIAVLGELRDRGISIAIDDFGIGKSSLACLKRLPVRAVKIDRSFVQGIPYNHGDSAITKAIISLAHHLECSVIAEGTETQQQFDFLRDNDCDTVQGYYFSAPMPAEHFEDLIRVQSKLHLH